MSRWPKDNEADLIRFFGHPGPEIESQLVHVVPPFQMFYEGKRVKSLLFHKKAADALAVALNAAWVKCGQSQSKVDALGISKTAGTYNHRKIAGSSRWSNHAFGGAIDVNAEDNGFNTGHGTIPQILVDAFDSVFFRWGGRYRGRTDPMHFEACDDGRIQPATFAALSIDAGIEFLSYSGEAHEKGCCLVDDVQNDEIPDDHDEPQAVAPAREPEEKPKSFFQKVWAWISGGGVASLGVGGGLFYGIDWRAVVALGLVGFAVFIIIWFFPRKGA